MKAILRLRFMKRAADIPRAESRRCPAGETPAGRLGSWAASTILEPRIGTMYLFESPSPALRAPSPPLGEREGIRGWNSWKVLTLCFSFLSGTVFAASFESMFQQGVQAYVAGGYEQAASYFREAVAASPSSGALHNLGNAEWKAGRVGEAILAWERAQLLNPYSANTRANLRFARKAAQLDASNLVWYEICSTWLPVNAWPWLAAASFWLAVAMVMLPGIFHWRKADWHQALAAGGFAVFLLTIPALIGVHTRSDVGVIRAKDTPLRLTPTRNAQTLAKLPAGEMARIERERGEYLYVRTSGDAAGWLQREQLGRITSR